MSPRYYNNNVRQQGFIIIIIMFVTKVLIKTLTNINLRCKMLDVGDTRSRYLELFFHICNLIGGKIIKIILLLSPMLNMTKLHCCSLLIIVQLVAEC